MSRETGPTQSTMHNLESFRYDEKPYSKCVVDDDSEGL